MHYIIKMIATLMIPIFMQTSVVNIVDTTPREAIDDFFAGLTTGDDQVTERYMDNTYVNLLENITGDEEVVDRMYAAVFDKFSYKVEKIVEEDEVAAAKVTVTSSDFSKVLDAYNEASYAYVMDSLYTDEIADKEALNAKCLGMYVQQIEAAAQSETTVETVIYLPLADDGYYGWSILLTDELMKSIVGNLAMPIDISN
ncbi:MAG: hypothetical protein GX663_04480 [Clostridiales bacterium]|nr:hypothetical protein [Clostridiales bacterium]